MTERYFRGKTSDRVVLNKQQLNRRRPGEHWLFMGNDIVDYQLGSIVKVYPAQLVTSVPHYKQGVECKIVFIDLHGQQMRVEEVKE